MRCIGQCARDWGIQTRACDSRFHSRHYANLRCGSETAGGRGIAGDGVSVRSRRYWPAGREWNKTLLEEGFCILGARSLFNQERFFGPSFSNFSNKGDYDLRMRGTSWDGRCLVAVSADSIVRREPESCTRGSATVGFSGVPLSSKLAKRSRSRWAPVCWPTATPVVHLSMSCSSVLLSCFFLVEG